jgi:hypothetical protein
MPEATNSKAGVKNFNFHQVEQEKVLNKLEAELAKGDAADTKKLDRYARQINAFFHSQDASIHLMEQRDLSEALNGTNEDLVKKQKNFLGQVITAGSGAVGTATSLGMVLFVAKAYMAGTPYAGIEKMVEFVLKTAPMFTASLDATSKAVQAGDQASVTVVDHAHKTLTNSRNEGQNYRQNASSHVSEELRKLQDANAAEAAAWNAAARS